MPHFQMRKFALLKILKKYYPKNKNILEIGYGSGDIFTSYLELGMKITGYDFSELAFSFAKEKFAGNQNVTLLTEQYTIPEKHFDFVVACEVLEHIEDDQTAISKWISYLKKGGYLLISVPLHQDRWGKSDIEFGHFRRYEKKEILSLFTRNGLELKEFFCYDFPSCLFLDSLRNKRINLLADKYVNSDENKKVVGSKISGVARDESKIIQFLSRPFFITPIIMFQQLFYNTEWGSGAIFLATK